MGPRRLTLSQGLHAFLIYCESKNLSPQTLKWYRRRLSELFGLIGDIPVEQLDATKIREIILYLRYDHTRYPNLPQKKKTLGLAPGTVNGYIRILKAYFSFLQSEGLLDENPMARISQLKTTRDGGPFLTPEELSKMIRATSGSEPRLRRNLALLLVLADTGIRLGELCSIRIGDVDWTQRTIAVLGKGNKVRQVPFGRTTARALSSYLMVHPASDDPEGPLFASKDGNFLDHRGVHRIIKRIAKRAGITGKSISPHALRRTFATMWISNGGDPFSLQRILGHTTMEMVNRYVRLTTADLQVRHAAIGPVDHIGSSHRR